MAEISHNNKIILGDLALQIYEERMDRSQAKKHITGQTQNPDEQKQLIEELDAHLDFLLLFNQRKAFKYRLLYIGIAQTALGVVLTLFTFLFIVQFLCIGLLITGITLIVISKDIKLPESYEQSKNFIHFSSTLHSSKLRRRRRY